MMLALEAMADGGVEAGLSRDEALELAAQTMRGAATLALETDMHPAELKDAVTTPGGTTAAGLHALESDGLRAAFMDAVKAAVQKGRSLGGE
jgi:pyrroline-5-carboxylate reductase